MTLYKLSIITPTFNRGYILNVLFESLCNQSIKKFEWIIVDDGSTDNTEELVNVWKNTDVGFEINYIKQQNGGKHRALNKAIPQAQYEFIYIIDSDDYMVKNGVERIYKWLESISGNEGFAGVSGLRGKNNQFDILGQFPINKDYIDATNLERKKNNLLGDKAEVYRKDLLLKYPFPEFDGEMFIGESSVWNRIAMDGYKIRWFGEIICICEYLEDGLTKNMGKEVNLNNFEGYTYVEKLNAKTGKFPSNFLAIGRYTEVAKEKNISTSDVKSRLDINLLQLILGVLFLKLRKYI